MISIILFLQSVVVHCSRATLHLRHIYKRKDCHLKMPQGASETDSLLPTASASDAAAAPEGRRPHRLSRERLRSSRSSILAVAVFSVVVFILTWGIIFRGFQGPFGRGAPPVELPKDPLERAKALLDQHPLIDGVGSYEIISAMVAARTLTFLLDCDTR